ncbi:unnamed protein product, partial [Mesorhabditis belari]|uniref:ZP domain-containing protein n=1 Tax=Mesorhabditis belari TaxID=2138241 RepID=A0AAF3EH09_9BILA
MIERLFLLISCYLLSSNGFMFDNEIVGEPKVDCEDTMLALTFKTKKPFPGRVYVQGLSDDERCAQQFSKNTNQSRFSLVVNNGDCAMERHRVSGKLEGLMFSLTIVVSFHGTFVTKADRAYRCMCFFRSTSMLTNSIEMSGLGTTELVEAAPAPTCSYGIKLGSVDGPPVIEGQVGDKIFHVWECDNNEQRMLVHSCSVTDGKGYKFDLLDIDGCAIDPLIQPDLKYEDERNRAFTEVSGYKFSDTKALNYECVIELCKRDSDECEGFSPPNCGRAKRSISANVRSAPKNTWTVKGRISKREASIGVRNRISMLDALVERTIASDEIELKNSTMMHFESMSVPSVRDFLRIAQREICIPVTTLITVTLVFSLCIFVTLFVGCLMARRHVYKIEN